MNVIVLVTNALDHKIQIVSHVQLVQCILKYSQAIVVKIVQMAFTQMHQIRFARLALIIVKLAQE